VETATLTRTRHRSFADEHDVGLLDRTGFLRIDPVTAFAAIGLMVFSIVIIGLSTQNDVDGNPYYYVIRQGIYGIVGVALMLALARVDYSRFRELRVGIYGTLLILTTSVLLLSQATRGATRWIELPFFRFQPSEIGKVLLVLALAGFAIDRVRRYDGDVKRTVRLLALGGLPTTLILLQPDLDTALVYGVITVTVMFLAGINWRHFAALGGVVLGGLLIVLVIGPLFGFSALQGYQQERLTAFLNPGECNSQESCYQTQQSLIAIGAGGKTGQGEDATQATSGFLPEARTDFIFAVTAERWGFLGAAVLLSLYALLVWRALRIATLSKNLYGSLVAGAFAAMLLFQGFINVGMNLGILPVAGIPLPLVSYGGSSVLATFIAIGIIQSVYVQSQLASPSRVRPAL
jgi:rod shape determining protein RodA